MTAPLPPDAETVVAYSDDLVTLYHGDCLDIMAAMPDASVDAVVTDPPYGWEFMGKKWDAPWRESDINADAAFTSTGFTDGGERIPRPTFTGSTNPKCATCKGTRRGRRDGTAKVAVCLCSNGGKFPNVRAVEMRAFGEWCETWTSECLRVLKPGGHLLAFGGARTWHRLAVAVEDAGFEMRDSIAWLYGCHDDQTEALTARGWVNGLDLREDDLVAQWATDGTVSLVRPDAQQRYAFDGRMVRFRNADVDQLVTPNHRVYRQVSERSQVAGKRTSSWGQWQVDAAEDVNRWQPMRLPAAGVHDGPGIGGDDYAALLGWVWAEGGFDLTGTDVRVYQSSVNQPFVDEIAALLDRMGPHKRYDYQREWKGRGYTATTWFMSGELAKRVRADLPGKTPTWGLLWRMTAAEKRALWDAAMKGDGPKAVRTFWQKDRGALEWAQALLACINARGKVAADPRGALHWQPSPTVELQRRHLVDEGQNYTGEVWCVTVPSGAFIVRRNGKVSVSGNSGFPKSLDVSKAIDKAAGAERTPDAQRWQGWGTALKPAFEPIVVARKPLIGTVAANVLQYGTGALNIDATRVKTTDTLSGGHSSGGQQMSDGWHRPWMDDPEAVAANAARSRASVERSESLGRWPTNVVLSGDQAAEMDRQTGTLTSGKMSAKTDRSTRQGDAYGKFAARTATETYGDSGGASRFFPVFRYQAKAPSRERPTVDGVAHPTVKPVELMRWLVRLVTPPGGVVLEPFAGSGTTAEACVREGARCIAIEREADYLPLIVARLAKLAESTPVTSEPSLPDEVSP